MIIVNSREFRDNQKKYLDLVDSKIQVIIKRSKNRAYKLSRVSNEDRLFSNPEVIAEIKAGTKEIEEGKYVTVKKEDLAKYLGL